MEINNTAQLKSAIAFLEVDSAVKKRILVDQYHITTESLRPANLIKNVFNKIVDSNDITNRVIGTSVGLGAGILSKKLLIGKSTNIFKRILGTAIELAVASVVSKNGEAIKEKGVEIFRKLTNNNDQQQ